MEYIRDKSGNIVLAFDGDNLYYYTKVLDKSSDLDESISIEQLRIENNGGLKLFTILRYQEELGVISDRDFLITRIKESISFLARIITEHEKSISSLNNRIILEEMEGSGQVSAWLDCLCLIDNNKSFDLCRFRKDYLSASEIIEYYGLGENEYWDQIQANGEFLEYAISDIKNSTQLYDAIILIIKRENQSKMTVTDANWKTIINALLLNKETQNLGKGLESIINQSNVNN